MPRTGGSPPTDAKQHLADAIVTKEAQLRRMKMRLREKEGRDLHAQYVRVGKVVEAMGLLDAAEGELKEVLRVGLANCYGEDQLASLPHENTDTENGKN